jgi:predicted metal-dependent hydrolase
MARARGVIGLDDPFARGRRLFDAGEFFEAHEAWEERWRVATDRADRELLQGLIQVAAAFHKLLVMGSADAASRLLAKGLAKLDALPAHVLDMNLAAFRERLRACADDLAAGHLARAAIPTIRESLTPIASPPRGGDEGRRR